jgi:hypothetical protein
MGIRTREIAKEYVMANENKGHSQCCISLTKAMGMYESVVNEILLYNSGFTRFIHKLFSIPSVLYE